MVAHEVGLLDAELVQEVDHDLGPILDRVLLGRKRRRVAEADRVHRDGAARAAHEREDVPVLVQERGVWCRSKTASPSPTDA